MNFKQITAIPATADRVLQAIKPLTKISRADAELIAKCIVYAGYEFVRAYRNAEGQIIVSYQRSWADLAA